MIAPAHVGKYPLLARIITRPWTTDAEHARQRALDIGVVIARHEAHGFGFTETCKEFARGIPFLRQPNIGDIARTGDMVRALVAHILHKRGEEFHVMRAV